MRFHTLVAAALCAVGAGSARPALAQAADTTGAPSLTLEQAVGLALKNNPDYLQVVAQIAPANARVRSAYGAFVPNAGVSLSGGYLGQGGITVSGVPGLVTGSDQVQSSYGIGLNYSLSAATFINPSLQTASMHAAESDVQAAAATLRSNVADAYLLVLVDEANAALQDSLIASNQVQVDLARAKMAAGSGTQLDVSKALVDLGNQRIAAIRAHNQVQVDKLSLFQIIGVPEPVNVRLVSRPGVAAPAFSLDSVLALARNSNPALAALQSRAKAADKGVSSAKGNYLPTLSAFAQWGGYANEYTNSNYPVSIATSQFNSAVSACRSTDSIRAGAGLGGSSQCAALYGSSVDTAAIKSANNAVPWHFTSAPFQAGVTLSLTILDGLSRWTTLETAQAQRSDAYYQVHAQELRITQEVTSAYLTLAAAFQAEGLARDNMAQAQLALRLAQEKYRVGSATAVDLSTQRDDYQRAVQQLLASIFDYHRAFAALERAVGRPLR
ncbi:MAG TPA: TolC family protein [Gemmatimonadaceae bacterium]|nr:TolC family protein [Gemmatimonadaceae bacterium]